MALPRSRSSEEEIRKVESTAYQAQFTVPLGIYSIIRRILEKFVGKVHQLVPSSTFFLFAQFDLHHCLRKQVIKKHPQLLRLINFNLVIINLNMSSKSRRARHNIAANSIDPDIGHNIDIDSILSSSTSIRSLPANQLYAKIIEAVLGRSVLVESLPAGIIEAFKASLPEMDKRLKEVIDCGDIVQLKMARDVASELVSDDVERWNRSDERRLCFELGLVYLLTSKYHKWLNSKGVEYNESKEDLLNEYQYADFENLDDSEVEALVKFRYVTNVLKIIVDRPKKGLFLDLVTRAVQNYSYKYVQGSGPSRATRLRIKIFETECDVVPRRRGATRFKTTSHDHDASPYSSDSGHPTTHSLKRKQEHQFDESSKRIQKVSGRRRRQNSPSEEAVALLRDTNQDYPQTDFFPVPYLQHDQHDHVMASLSGDPNDASSVTGKKNWLELATLPVPQSPLSKNKSKTRLDLLSYNGSNLPVSTSFLPFPSSQFAQGNLSPSNQNTPLLSSSSPFATDRTFSPFKLPTSQGGNENGENQSQSSFHVPDFDRPSNFAHLVRTLPPPPLIRGCSLGMVDLDV